MTLLLSRHPSVLKSMQIFVDQYSSFCTLDNMTRRIVSAHPSTADKNNAGGLRTTRALRKYLKVQTGNYMWPWNMQQQTLLYKILSLNWNLHTKQPRQELPWMLLMYSEKMGTVPWVDQYHDQTWLAEVGQSQQSGKNRIGHYGLSIPKFAQYLWTWGETGIIKAGASAPLFLPPTLSLIHPTLYLPASVPYPSKVRYMPHHHGGPNAMLTTHPTRIPPGGSPSSSRHGRRVWGSPTMRLVNV